MQKKAELIPAPLPETVRYLAIFHRAFKVIASYRETRNPEEALLGGELADALHNVPSLLRNYSESAWHKPSEIDNWVSSSFPQQIASTGAPEEIVTLCHKVVSREGTAQELGLRDDLSNLSLAPPEVLDRCLSLFRNACLTIRGLTNFGNYEDVSSPGRKSRLDLWRDLKSIWTDEADELSLFCAHLAETVLPVIPALVRWDTFDEAAFQQKVMVTKALVPERFQKHWESQFTLR